MFSSRRFRFASLLAGLAMAFSMAAVDHADARRGGSFGSRGGRTFQSAPSTATAPRTTAPVERSMTPNAGPQSSFNNNAGAQRPGGFMSGFGGSMLRGLAIGGLFGMLLGHGFGGFGGMGSLLMQVLLIGGGIYLVTRFMRRRETAQPAMGGAGLNRAAYEGPAPSPAPAGGGLGSFRIPGIGSKAPGAGPRRPANPDEIGVTPDDLSTFERMLAEVQTGFGREDYAVLRRLTTPEMMGYLSEELGQNASNGVRNEVSDVRLLQGDLAESWSEGGRDYATVAMRYAAIEAMRDRASGKVMEGDAERPSETTEIWTFVRDNKRDWKLSAIQEA